MAGQVRYQRENAKATGDWSPMRPLMTEIERTGGRREEREGCALGLSSTGSANSACMFLVFPVFFFFCRMFVFWTCTLLKSSMIGPQTHLLYSFFCCDY